MADITGYYRYDALSPITQGGVAVATPGESKYFDEWVALIYNGQAQLMVEAIDTYGYFSLQPAPPVTSDHLVLASPADTTAATLFDKIGVTGGLTKSIVNPGANEQLVLDAAAAVGSPATIFYLNTAGTLNIPMDGSFVPVPFPTASIANAFVTPDVTFIEYEAITGGLHDVEAWVTIESGNSQCRRRIQASVDTGGGFAAMTGTLRYSWTADAGMDEQTIVTRFPWVAAIGDLLRIEVATDGGTTQAQLLATGCGLYIRA